MRLSFFIGSLLVCLSGCAAKQLPAESNLVPTRSDLLQTFESSGSWCLDALVANFLSAGCSGIQSQNDGGGTVIRCVTPQLGATDAFSNRTFVVIPRQIVQQATPPDNVHLVCLDAQLGVFITTD